jgi:hypothetical protein
VFHADSGSQIYRQGWSFFLPFSGSCACTIVQRTPTLKAAAVPANHVRAAMRCCAIGLTWSLGSWITLNLSLPTAMAGPPCCLFCSEGSQWPSCSAKPCALHPPPSRAQNPRMRYTLPFLIQTSTLHLVQSPTSTRACSEQTGTPLALGCIHRPVPGKHRSSWTSKTQGGAEAVRAKIVERETIRASSRPAPVSAASRWAGNQSNVCPPLTCSGR